MFKLPIRALHSFLDFKRNQDRIQTNKIPLTELEGESEDGKIREPVDPAPAPEECLMQNVSWDEIIEASKELNHRQQELFRLKWIKEKSVREIAEAMIFSENAASQAIQRMEARLGKILVQRGVVEEPQRYHWSPPSPQAIISISFEGKSR